MSDITRRDMVGYLAGMPVVIGLGGTGALERAAEMARAALETADRTGRPFAPEFFTPHEWRTVRLLVDLVIPSDHRSGSATDAGVPEFMDFMMGDRPQYQDRMRDGLAWMDEQAESRFGAVFVDAAPAQRTAILDDIAWPDRAPDGMEDGVRFFNFFRDLTSSGFWSSRMGVEDLGYTGNTVVPVWNGCPPAALRKLGVSYEGWD